MYFARLNFELYNMGILKMSSVNNKGIVWSYNFRPDVGPDNHNIWLLQIIQHTGWIEYAYQIFVASLM